MIIVDSDVLIDALAGIEPQRSVVEEGLRMRRLAVPAIVHFELLMGARSEAELRRIQHLLRPMAVLDFHREAAEEAASVGRRLTGQGVLLPMADLAIAGICLSMDRPLLTRNTTHFGRIETLRLEPLPAQGRRSSTRRACTGAGRPPIVERRRSGSRTSPLPPSQGTSMMRPLPLRPTPAPVRPAAVLPRGPRRSPQTAVITGALGTPGRSLEPGLRRSMEHRFQHDFASVRLHAGPAAGAAARALGAAAFTVGSEIVLGDGGGPELLAHELTHVVQQRRGSGRAGEATEGEARRNAAAAGGSGPLSVGLGAPVGTIQCQEKGSKKAAEGTFGASAGGGPKKGKPSNSYGFDASYKIPLVPGLGFGSVAFLDQFDLKLKGSSTSEEPLLDSTALQKLQLDLALRLARLELLKLKLGKGEGAGELTLGGTITGTGGIGFSFGPEPDNTNTLGGKAALDAGLKTPNLIPSRAGKLTLGVGVGGEAGASRTLGPESAATESLGAKGKVSLGYESPAILGGAAKVKVGAEVGAGIDWTRKTGEDPALAGKLSAGGSVRLEGTGKGAISAPFIEFKVSGDTTLDAEHRQIEGSNSSVTVTGGVGFRFGSGGKK